MQRMMLPLLILTALGCDKTIHEVRAPLPLYGPAIADGTERIGTPIMRSITISKPAAISIDTTLTMKPILNQ